jgi:hypothetical protein
MLNALSGRERSIRGVGRFDRTAARLEVFEGVTRRRGGESMRRDSGAAP